MKEASQEKRSTSWKPERAVYAKINQWRVSTEEWRFRLGQSCNQDDILEDSKMLTSGSLWKSSWDHLIRKPMCPFVWIIVPTFIFLDIYPNLAWLNLFFSRINHYFLFFETLLGIHNWAFMHYCKRFRGQWKKK